jgi:hypothetical protein
MTTTLKPNRRSSRRWMMAIAALLIGTVVPATVIATAAPASAASACRSRSGC